MATEQFDAAGVAQKTIEVLGGREKAFALIDKEFGEINARWNQDVIAIGRILRAHLYVEYYMTEFLEKANPRLGRIDDARLSFAQKLNLLESDPRIQLVVPGIKRLNAVRNRLAHNLDVRVTDDDVQVFFSDGYFKAIRFEGAKPGTPSTDPLDILEAFAQYASSTLRHEFSIFGTAFGQAYDALHPKKDSP